MLSKEEIEKAKERIKNICDKSLNNISYDHVLTTLELHYLRLLLQYIDQLEQNNNKQNKIIDEIIKNWKQDDYRGVEEIKQYFEKKVEEK